MSSGHYHDQMVRLATDLGTGRGRVSIQPLAFGRLIVHGSCRHYGEPDQGEPNAF